MHQGGPELAREAPLLLVMAKPVSVVQFVDSRAQLAAQYTHHRLCSAVQSGVSQPYFAASKRRSNKRQKSGSLGHDIENTPGLCDWLSANHAYWREHHHTGGHVHTQIRSEARHNPTETTAPVWTLVEWDEFLARLPGACDVESEVHLTSCASGEKASVPAISLDHAQMLFRRVLCHAADHESVLSTIDRRWLLPPRVRFLMAPMCCWASALLSGSHNRSRSTATDCLPDNAAIDGYRIIVLDPPWQNKSVKRLQGGGGYSTSAWQSLPDFPLNSVCSPAGTLVAVWVTNKQSYWQWLVDVVFPHWNVEYVTTWYWLKVTNQGVPVLPLDARRERKPFEPIVIGICRRTQDGRSPMNCREASRKMRPATAVHSSISRSDQAGSILPLGVHGLQHSAIVRPAPDWSAAAAIAAQSMVAIGPIPMQRIILSVPMAHSAKPPLDSLLEQCFVRPNDVTKTPASPGTPIAASCASVLGPDPTARLELFARALRSGWTCVGNEVLSQQEISAGNGFYVAGGRA